MTQFLCSLCCLTIYNLYMCVQNGIEQKFVELMAQRAELQAAAQAEDETNKLTKKQRVALQKEAAAAKTRRETVGEDRMVPQVCFRDISTLNSILLACLTQLTFSLRSLNRADSSS